MQNVVPLLCARLFSPLAAGASAPSGDAMAVADLDTRYQAAVKANDAATMSWKYVFGQASIPLPKAP